MIQLNDLMTLLNPSGKGEGRLAASSSSGEADAWHRALDHAEPTEALPANLGENRDSEETALAADAAVAAGEQPVVDGDAMRFVLSVEGEFAPSSSFPGEGEPVNLPQSDPGPPAHAALQSRLDRGLIDILAGRLRRTPDAPADSSPAVRLEQLAGRVVLDRLHAEIGGKTTNPGDGASSLPSRESVAQLAARLQGLHASKPASAGEVPVVTAPGTSEATGVPAAETLATTQAVSGEVDAPSAAARPATSEPHVAPNVTRGIEIPATVLPGAETGGASVDRPAASVELSPTDVAHDDTARAPASAGEPIAETASAPDRTGDDVALAPEELVESETTFDPSDGGAVRRASDTGPRDSLDSAAARDLETLHDLAAATETAADDSQPAPEAAIEVEADTPIVEPDGKTEQRRPEPAAPATTGASTDAAAEPVAYAPAVAEPTTVAPAEPATANAGTNAPTTASVPDGTLETPSTPISARPDGNPTDDGGTTGERGERGDTRDPDDSVEPMPADSDSDLDSTAATDRPAAKPAPTNASSTTMTAATGSATSATVASGAEHAAATAAPGAISGSPAATQPTAIVDGPTKVHHQALATAIASRASSVPKDGSMELRFALEPDDLGTVRVRIESRGDQMTIRILASSSAAVDVLTPGIARLVAQLTEAGAPQPQIDLGFQESAERHPQHTARDGSSGEPRRSPTNAEETPWTPGEQTGQGPGLDRTA